ncbi:uncharacterized protein Tco025E_07895 [Trypanosoma conorhini]|uniref:Uncharacterized protein n=1 Tax=Trypanosoma conorhini TaxID=83891 RepID=A0A422NHD2_9TRYP|nr:uncharacterized protein Tco025E_07895 [Trypanosoma conorhini]RNF04883.1 hypothetical protein Tco025E_07895 [Trypanosoma conorhini]
MLPFLPCSLFDSDIGSSVANGVTGLFPCALAVIVLTAASVIVVRVISLFRRRRCTSRVPQDFRNTQWRLEDSYYYNGEWDSQKLSTYAFLVEEQQKHSYLVGVFDKKCRGYICPSCNNFIDRDVETVRRHHLHCVNTLTPNVISYRGWWAQVDHTL